jgi:predicted MPP superfamily phosphohydrolase
MTQFSMAHTEPLIVVDLQDTRMEGSEKSSTINTHNVFQVYRRFLIRFSIPFLLLAFTITPACTQISGTSATYSFVHLSDTQNLASGYPETYDYTFSYLESIKERYNISAIIITGDLVNTWNDSHEWDAYTHAIHKTSIPLYVIAGNHDTDQEQNYQYYTRYTGNTNTSYVTSLENFDLVGINSVFGSLKSRDVTSIRQTLLNSSKNFTIIATHYYMDEKGTLSPQGKDIDQQLIVKPTIILSGHKHGVLIRERKIGQYPVIEDLTDYQDGIPGGSTSENISAGTFYTVTTRDDQVVKISAKIIWISPRQSFDTEHVLYDISVPEPPLAEITLDCSSSPGICGDPTNTSIITNVYRDWENFIEFIQGPFHFF